MIKFKDIFDVSKGNGLAPVTIVLSAPFVAIAMVLFLLAGAVAWLAIIIGRRPAFNVILGFLENIGIRQR